MLQDRRFLDLGPLVVHQCFEVASWRVAVVLTDAGWPPVRAFARWVLRATATGGAVVVRNPALDPAVLGRLRQTEREGVDLADLLQRLRRRLDAVEDPST